MSRRGNCYENAVAKKSDIVVAVNGHVVFDAETMEACDKFVFRCVIQLVKQTGDGNPLRLICFGMLAPPPQRSWYLTVKRSGRN